MLIARGTSENLLSPSDPKHLSQHKKRKKNNDDKKIGLLCIFISLSFDRYAMKPQPATITAHDQQEGLHHQPGAFRVQGNRSSDNNDSVEEESTVVSPYSVAQDSVIRIPEAQLVDPAFTEAAMARALQAAREETERAERELRAVREELQHQEQTVEAQQTEFVQQQREAPTAEEEEPRNSFRSFIRKHAVVSCVLCSILSLGAVGAGVGVAFSSSSGKEKAGISGLPSSSPPTTVEESPTSLEETTAPTLNPTPARVEESTKKPTSLRPTVTPIGTSTAPPVPSTVDGISSWTRVGSTLKGVATGDLFGSSHAVALSSDGSILAVGAKRNDDIADRAGYVQVFQRDGETDQQPDWQPMGAALKGVAVDDSFGTCAALSSNGRILAVGATEYFAERPGPGYVRVFEYDSINDQWNPRGSKIVGVAAYDWFGTSLALSSDGNKLAVAAPGNDDKGLGAGRVRVFAFNRNSNEWVQYGSIVTGAAEFDEFGNSLDLSANGRILAVGAWGNDDNGFDSGNVRVFQFNSNSNYWDPLGETIPGVAEYDWFGTSVALSSNGTVLVAGAALNNDNGTNSGHVRVFDYNTTANQWIQRGSAIVGAACR